MLTIYSKIYEIQNIILAISSASVYQMDRHLVKYENIDIFNTKLIDKYTKEILKKLKDVLENDTFFKCQMYLKPKKLENGKIKYRPIYVTDFITLSAIFAILNILVYSDSKIQGVKKVNETFGAFPENFYGNIISEDCGKFFEPWMKQYQKYSKVYIDKYSAYNKSRKYEYEFNLDLKNFFPSINPEVIFYMLKSKISKNIDNNDFIQYEKLILKTLMIETDVKDKDLIDRIDISDFVIDCKLKDMENIRFAKGLPQGLPQACLYSNLIMEGISDEYRKTFDGDSIFYVDDSVIFSNLPTDKFTDKLKELQNKIKERFNKYIENGITEENENSSINIYYSFFSKFRNIYEIQFNEDKCNYNLIENDIFIFLNNFLQKKTSRNNDIYNAASDEKDYDGILEDFLFYDDIISKEESFIKEENIKDFINIDEINSYKRKIIRLKKYYHYRHLVAQGYSETEKLEVLIDKEIQDIQKYKQENLFEYLNDGILSPLVGLIYKFLPSNKAKEKIYQLKVIFKKNDLLSVMYYNKLFIYKNIRPNNHCLYDFLTDKLNFFSVQSSDYVYDSVKKIFNNTNNNFPCTKFDFVNHALSTLNIKWTEINKYEMLINNSSKYIREIMNQIFSILFNVDNSTQYTLINKRGHSLYDYQFKILFYIRNKNFDFNKVYSLIKTLSMEDKFIGKKVDPSIVEVIPYFERNVGDIQKINTLLSAHEFVKKIWSNGSKYLYFYTLHDEMHSVKLIQNIDKLLTSISYFELKQEEYFILYLSCYLHDISMVLQKNVESEFFNDNYEGTIFISEITNLLKKDINEKNKYYKIYQMFEEYFEKIVRTKHAKNSGYLIRNSSFLDFLDGSHMRKTIAEICEFHNVEARKVYYSDDEDITFNTKLVKILLRLSDVFDFSRDRVSKEFLDSSIDYMNCESKFHYIMHYITGDYLLDKVYSENFTKLSGIIDKLSYVKRLANDRYVENVIIGINIQDDILTSPNVFDTNCMGNEMFFRSERLPENYMYSQEFDNDVINSSKKVLKNDIMYEIKDFDCSDVCDKNKCSFMCRLLSKKYIDMLRELHYLENYINNIVKKDSRTASLPVHFYVLFKIEDSNIKNKHLHNLLIDYFKQK